MVLKRIDRRKIFLLLGDALIVCLSFYLAVMVRIKTLVGLEFLENRVVSFLFLLLAYLVSFYIFGLYDIQLNFRSRRSLYLILASLIMTSFSAVIFFYFFPFQLKRGIFFISLILITLLVYVWRLFYSFLFRVAVPIRRVLIVGTGEPAQEIHERLKSYQDYLTVGFITDDPETSVCEDMRILGDSRSIEEIAKTEEINEIIITVDPAENSRLSRGLVNCKVMGISMYDMARFYEYLENKLPLPFVEDHWILYGPGFSRVGSRVYMRLKRIMDLILSSFLLICFLPLGLVIALLIKLSSHGPVFFVQERLGKNFVPFKMYKFRTMVFNAEKDEPLWADVNDTRVTDIGRILRKTRLDEIPQLVNIISGDMSFIGPRPERKYFVKELKGKIPLYSLRFSIKPGLTGWAQVNYRYGASEEDAKEKLRYELFYIKNMSFILDLRIFLKTIRIVLFGMGR
ncbi:sugar transferase [Acidobacteriota bacterium]